MAQPSRAARVGPVGADRAADLVFGSEVFVTTTPWNISGKTVVLTGGTTGIGRATVEELARRGAHITFTARRPADGDLVVAEVTASVPEAVVGYRELQLDDLASVRLFARRLRSDFDSIDVLINNAGISLSERRLTADGFEMMFGVNHLGHFLLVEEIRPLLLAAGTARVVIVASDAHRFGGPLDFDDLQSERSKFGALGGLRVYGRSKLANMLHARQLAATFADDAVTVNCLHPGFVRTRLARDGEATMLGERFVWPLVSKFARSPLKGATASLYAACSPDLSKRTGLYLVDEKVKQPAVLALDDSAAARLWNVSAELVGLAK
jgi:NAD(P)-dependent dehydrogenase (short-subunit alcohol dehydrogenase family)